MRRREHNASNEDDNILAVRKDGQSVSERLRSCCNGFADVQRVLAGTPQLGSLPAVT